MKSKMRSLGEGSSSPLLPMFRASVASAPPNFLSATWLTNTNCGASRSSLSTIDSEGIKEKDGSPDRYGGTSDSTKDDSKRREFWTSEGHSLESLSRILGIMSLVCFSVGAGLTIVGFASRGLPLNASLLFQILGPVLLAAAFVTFLLGNVLGRLWKGEWKKRQLEMETVVRMKLEKLTKEILIQQNQHRILSYPQHILSQLSPESIVERIPLEVGVGVTKITKRSRFFSKHSSLVNISSSTETTTANSRRSSKLINDSSNQVDQAIEGLSNALMKRELERRLDPGTLLARKTNLFPTFDLPGIQISRIETLDLDQASGSSCCSAKRYIIVHSDVASSDFSFASEYSLLSTARSRSRSRSSNASLFDFSPRDSEWDADVSLGSRDSQTSITGRSSISGRDYSTGLPKQYYPFHRVSCGQSQQQHFLLLPSCATDLSGVSNGASLDDCPSSPRRHSSPVSQNYKRIDMFGPGGCDRMNESFFPSEFDPNSQSFASRLNLAARHPYSSCSPLLLKPSSGTNNDNLINTSGSAVTDGSTSAKGSDNLEQNMSRSQLLYQQMKCSQPIRKFSYDEQRRVSWLRKRSYGDQSVISMKITEDSDDEEKEKRDLFDISLPVIEGETDARYVVDTICQEESKDCELQLFKQQNDADRSQTQNHEIVDRSDSNENKIQIEPSEVHVDPRWRHFFDGSASMAMVASATVSSVIDKKRASMKRNTTDDSEVERRVAKLLKEIEFSATDSVDDCSRITKDSILNTRPILNFFSYDSKSSDGTSLSLRARRDSFAGKGRQQQTTSSSSSSQPFSLFASRQLSLQPPSRGVEVQTQTDELLEGTKPTVDFEKSPNRKPDKRKTSKLTQNLSTESSSGVSLHNDPSGVQSTDQAMAGGASKLKFFAKALPQVIAAATNAAAMECNRLVSAKNLVSKKRRRKQKSGSADGAPGTDGKN